MAHDVFISYSTKDKTIADAVCAKLEEGGIRAWIAPRDVPAGSNFAESIIDAIDTCKVFILIWSENTNASQHILNEVNQAFNQGIIIIPFRIQDVQPTSAMRYYIGRTHWLDAIDPPLENHIANLREIILINLGREISSPPAVSAFQEPSGAAVRPPDQQPGERKPTPGMDSAAKPPARSSRQQTGQAVQPAGASGPSLTRFIPLAIGAMAILTLVVLLLAGVFKGPAPTGMVEDLPDQTESSPAPETGLPTETAERTEGIPATETGTPFPAWVEDAKAYSEPILAAVQDRLPDFGDDFSQTETAWIYTDEDPGVEDGCDNPDNLKQTISDGVMMLSLVNCQAAILSHPDLEFTNYVLQVDLHFQQNPSPLGFEFRSASQSPDGNPLFYIKVNGGLWGTSFDQGGQAKGDRGSINLDFSQPITITIIHQSPEFLVLVDSIPLTYNISNEVYRGPFILDFKVNSWYSFPLEPYTLELDNFKIWDLDKIQ